MEDQGRSRPRRCATVVDALRSHADSGAEGTVGAAAGDQPGYPAFWNSVRAAAEHLTAGGMRPGDHVAVEMESTTNTLVAAVAVLAAGGVLVPLGATGRLRPGTQDCTRTLDALRISGARLCLAADPGSFREALAPTELRTQVLATAECASGRAQATDWQPAPLDPDRPALVQFSSGSVAAPKGIVLTHRNLTANLDALTRRIGVWHGRAVVWLPLSHDMGLIGSFLSCLYSASAIRVLTPRSFIRDPLTWIEELSSFRATHTAAATFGYDLAERAASRAPERLTGLDLSRLTAAIIGAERIAPGLCERFERRFRSCGLRPHAVLPAYGLAENCVAVAVRAPLAPSAFGEPDTTDPRRTRLTTASAPTAGPAPTQDTGRHRLIGHGAPLPGTEVRIVSETGEPLSDGEVGEILIGGEAACHWFVGAGGLRRPARDDDGFVPTGDLGAMKDGELYVIGRSKETLSYAGRTISPVDVEQTVLAAVPGQLNAAAAVALPLRDAGEDLVLFLELARAADEQATSLLADAVRLAVLRDFRIPVQEVYVGRRGALPRTTSGKVRRLGLAAAHREGTLGRAFRPAAPSGPGRPRAAGLTAHAEHAAQSAHSAHAANTAHSAEAGPAGRVPGATASPC
ncbi:AMP-binding protein [Streptomyces sp. URMC 127]|uniref:AMP-binding protein n=1 Tax=Streptomyces sp. URMC 127 TaxID=3423402 RepID=UPI003F1999B4